MDSMSHHPWLHRFSILVVFATAVLLYSGGTVTSFNAGLAVPDWPLSFGEVFPDRWTEMLNVFIEHRHRLIGATVGLLVIGLATWNHAVQPRRWLRRFGWALLVAVIVQGLLGGLRVTELSTGLAVVHGCTGQIFFCMTVLMAAFTSRSWHAVADAAESPAATGYQRTCLALTLLLIGQLVAGALQRHTANGLAVHVIGAILIVFLLGLVVMWTLGDFGARRGLALPAKVLGALIGVQVMLGIGSWMVTAGMDDRFTPTLAQWLPPTAHVVVGACMLATSVLLTANAYRLVRLPMAAQAAGLWDYTSGSPVPPAQRGANSA